MTLKEKLQFLSNHTDGRDFQVKNEYGYWITVTLDGIDYMAIKRFNDLELRETERK